MKKFFKEHYHLHLLVGGLIGWVLSTTFDGVPLFFQFFLTIFVSTAIATMWEWGWAAAGKAIVDYWDVAWTVIGAVTALIIILN
jgi:hypothetical protein